MYAESSEEILLTQSRRVNASFECECHLFDDCYHILMCTETELVGRLS